MICALLLTYLAAGGRRDLFRWVLLGAGIALVVAAGVGIGLYSVARLSFVGSTAQTWFETVTFGLAVVVLTYMTFWMKRNAREMTRHLRGSAAEAVAGGSALALAIVAGVTVGREAVETSIFMVAIALQSSPVRLLAGAAAGLGIALVVALAIYRVGVRVNIARFFTVVGASLMVVAAGLLANPVHNLQDLGVLGRLPGAAVHLWNTGGLIPQESTLGDILHGLLGYAASPTALQVVVYAAFLVVGLSFFLRPARPRRAV
jgi:high-affinity iron transporter